MVAKHNIQQRGSKFRVDVTKNGTRQRVTCDTHDEALSVLARLELASSGLSANQWSIQEAYEACLAQVWSKGRNVEAATRNGKYAVEFFGADTPLDAISTVRIDGWIARLAQIGNAKTTINNKLNALSKLMTFAMERRKMDRKPHIERQSRKGFRMRRFLTQEEEDTVLALFGRWGQDCHAEAVCVLADTGIRPSELWALERSDVHPDVGPGVISLDETKTSIPRSVPTTPRVKDILARRCEMIKTGPLFPHNNWWLGKAWRAAKKEMGLSEDRGFVPYSLRHTCASRLVQRGVELVVVQEWMGHANMEMTRRYAKLCPKNLFDAVKVLERGV